MAKKKVEKSNRSKKPKSAQERIIDFVEAYLRNFNASAAYKAVFDCPNVSWAAVEASKFLNHPEVQQYLQQRLKERRTQLHVDQAYVVHKLTEIVETDFTQSMRVMTYKQIEALPVEVRKLIQGVKLKKKTFENEQENGRYNSTTTEEYEVTFMSKDKAIEALGRHTGTFMKDNVRGNVDLGQMSFTDMVKGMADIPEEIDE